MRAPHGVAVRAAVEALPPYRGLTGARPAVRLDGNENPFGPSPRAAAALRDVPLSRYPDAEPLCARWAAALGVPRDAVALSPGSGPALALAAELVLDPGDACLLLAPSFELYGWAARRRAARIVAVPCAAGRPFPARAVRAALAREAPKLALLGLPDNPTGVAPSVTFLERVTREHPGTLFLVDEAYVDFHGVTAVPLTRRRANLLVTRTFSKAYGLAGLRIGGLIGPPALIERVRRINVPYPVAAPAVAAGLAALDDPDHVRRTVRAAHRTRHRLARALRALGLPIVAPRVNFVLMRLETAAAARRLVGALARRGIAVRDRSHLPGMAGVVRVSCGTDHETDRFLAAMRDLRVPRRRARGRRP
jgi:histidinol-phosphate aminotransferase